MAFSPVIWLAAGIILMACEIIMPGFIIFWFGAGGILTALFIFAGFIPQGSAEWQWIFFFMSSAAFIGLWQLFLRKKFQSGASPSSRDETLVHLRGRALSAIMPGVPGEVELYSVYHGIKKWQAESSEAVGEGDEVEVIDSKGIKLLVKKI